jgi:hypothetical protein
MRTFATGFVGSAMVQALLRSGACLIGLPLIVATLGLFLLRTERAKFALLLEAQSRRIVREPPLKSQIVTQLEVS